MAAAFEGCGISRDHLLRYPLPYLFAVLPRLLAGRAAQNPFLAPAARTQAGKPYGADGKLRARDVMEVFGGLC